MKKLVINWFAIIVVGLFFACDSAEELADIDFNSTLVQSLPVVVTTTDEMTSSILLDATKDAEIEKYADKIKEYEITELLFAIENYDAPTDDEIYFNGYIGFSNKAESQASSTCSISPLNVTHVEGTGDFPISTCNDVVNDLSELFASDNAIKIYMTGTFTNAPLSFELKVTAKVKVTANPL